MDTSKGQIRKWAHQLARDEQPGEERNPELVDLDEEKRVYEELTSRPGSGQGWTVASKQPLHRLNALNPEVVGLINRQLDEKPLLSKIECYGEMDWWMARSVVNLTDAELDSLPVYRELYEALVAEGKAPPRDIVETDPGEEPSGGELYRIAKAIKEGLARFPYPSDIQRRASILYSSIITGGTASEILDRAFRFHEGPSILFVLAEMAQVVPEVGRLVTWLEHGEAA